MGVWRADADLCRVALLPERRSSQSGSGGQGRGAAARLLPRLPAHVPRSLLSRIRFASLKKPHKKPLSSETELALLLSSAALF